MKSIDYLILQVFLDELLGLVIHLLKDIVPSALSDDCSTNTKRPVLSQLLVVAVGLQRISLVKIRKWRD